MPATKSDRGTLIQVRLPEDLVRDLDHLSIDWGVYRAEVMERLLRDALQRYREQGSLWPTRP